MEAKANTYLGVYLAEFYALERGISSNTEGLMRVSVKRFSTWLGREAVLADLTDFQVSRFLRDLEGSGCWAAKTISGRRGDLLALWRHAAEDGAIPGPHRVRGVKVPEPMPVAWSLEEFGRLLDAAGEVVGYLVNGLPRSRYFWTLLKAAYETGLRRSDLFRLRLRDVDGSGVVVICQHKTGRAHAAAVREDTRAAIVALAERLEADGQPFADMPLRWPNNLRGFYYWMDRLTSAAGVRPGALQQCRRTGATHSERVQRGAAASYLGHADGSRASRHYIDASQAYGVTLPPAPGKVDAS